MALVLYCDKDKEIYAAKNVVCVEITDPSYWMSHCSHKETKMDSESQHEHNYHAAS